MPVELTRSKRVLWQCSSLELKVKSEPWNDAAMARKHSMPCGAECLSDGGVRFRLWAPKPERVDVLIDGSSLQMKKDEAGWFEIVTKQAKAGSRYQFVIDGLLHGPD